MRSLFTILLAAALAIPVPRAQAQNTSDLTLNCLLYTSVEEIGRLRLRGNQFLIGLKHRFMKIRRAEVTAVYEQVLFPVRLFSHRRMAHVSFDLHDRGLYGHIEQVIGQSFAANAGDPLPQVPWGQAVNQRIVVVKRKFDFGMAQRHPLEFGRQVTRLDGRFLEKTTPGRNIEEKIFNQELRPDGSCLLYTSRCV